MESKDKNLSNKKKSPEIKIKNMGWVGGGVGCGGFLGVLGFFLFL